MDSYFGQKVSDFVGGSTRVRRANDINEELVDAAVAGEFRVESGSEAVALSDEGRGAVAAGEDFDGWAGFDDAGGANEYHLQRLGSEGGFSGQNR
jgi:hypothetical protein